MATCACTYTGTLAPLSPATPGCFVSGGSSLAAPCLPAASFFRLMPRLGKGKGAPGTQGMEEQEGSPEGWVQEDKKGLPVWGVQARFLTQSTVLWCPSLLILAAGLDQKQASSATAQDWMESDLPVPVGPLGALREGCKCIGRSCVCMCVLESGCRAVNMTSGGGHWADHMSCTGVVGTEGCQLNSGGRCSHMSSVRLGGPGGDEGRIRLG